MAEIPRYITVHLGPPCSEAENIVVPFKEYIRNAASQVVYPTWHENALKANIYALFTQIMGKVSGRYYRNAGFGFDITADPSEDPVFIPGGAVFENAERIAEETFGKFIVRQGGDFPVSAEICDGVREKGKGLSKWGSLNLAEQGYSPLEILKFYYGDDIEVTNIVASP